jgi:hypothetical protein
MTILAPRIEVHPVSLRGQTYTVQLDEAGTFHAYNTGGIEAATAETRRALVDTLTKMTRQASATVSVPVTRLTNGTAQHGTATGIHATTRNILVLWDSGEREQLSVHRNEILAGMTEDEGREWGRLVEEQNAAGRAIFAFRKAHEIDLYATVRAQIAAQMAAEA